MVDLTPWRGEWAPDDPDAEFKAEVRAYQLLDPLATIAGLSAHTGIPEGALVRYVLARWASAGGEGLLQLGGHTVERLWRLADEAMASGDVEVQAAALAKVHGMLSWLRVPLQAPEEPAADPADPPT